jgi:hypothetical protein
LPKLLSETPADKFEQILDIFAGFEGTSPAPDPETN